MFSQLWRLQVQEQGQDQDQDHSQFLARVLFLVLLLPDGCPPSMGDRGRENCLMSLFIRTLISSWGSHLMISSKPDYLPKAPSPIASILRCSVSTHEFWRYTVESITPFCSSKWLKTINNIHRGTEMSPGPCRVLWAL